MALLPPPELGLPAPPDESLTVLDGFEAALDELPKKKPGNLLIGTWNIRHFGRVQTAWESKPRVSPKRIDKLDDANWRALVVDGSLSPPAELIDLPRTLGETKDKHSFYDQIAWFNKGKGAALTLKYKTAGNFVWDQHLLQDVGQSEKEARISDHYPLWAEFLLDA